MNVGKPVREIIVQPEPRTTPPPEPRRRERPEPSRPKRKEKVGAGK